MVNPFEGIVSALFTNYIFLVFLVFMHAILGYSLWVMAKKKVMPFEWLAWVPFGNFYLMSQYVGVHYWTSIPFILTPIFYFLHWTLGVILFIFSWTMMGGYMYRITKEHGLNPWYGVLATATFIGVPGLLAYFVFKK